MIFEKVSWTFDSRSRIAIVGPNGAGKSTLLNIICNKLKPKEGGLTVKNKLRVGTLSQHHVDQLDVRLSPLLTMASSVDAKEEELRQHLASYGINASLALKPIYLLSGGQKARVALALAMWCKPHLLLLDEPTNHLDMDSIGALVLALNSFTGGVVVVSHDQWLVEKIADDILVVDNNLKSL